MINELGILNVSRKQMSMTRNAAIKDHILTHGTPRKSQSTNKNTDKEIKATISLLLSDMMDSTYCSGGGSSRSSLDPYPRHHF